MEDYGPATYGERIAEIYDELYGSMFDVDATAAFLAARAAGGPVLELAVGTGRVALPLAATGVEVHGVDISPAMVEKLRAKPGGSEIQVTMGDFADVPVEGPFPLVYVVFSTLFALLEQEDQLRCFANVAAHLTDGGLFVVEAFVPDPCRFDRHQRVDLREVAADAVHLNVARHDPVNQRIDTQNIIVRAGGVRLYPARLRYIWPPEMDLMARLAGLGLLERWGGWNGEPFTSDSQGHVSVYEKTPV